MSLDLAVIESRWWRDGNSSVRGLFDVLADIHEDNPAAYHYEMFNNRESLREIVRRTARRYRNIYIGAHGNDRQIFGAEGRRENNISRAAFRNMIRSLADLRRSRLRGLFVGSCKFINRENACFLLSESGGRRSKIRWVAGYSRRIDFIDSSIADLFFWNTYYHTCVDSESNRIRAVAQVMDEFIPGAHETLAFNIFLRQGRNVRTLLPVSGG